MLQYAIRNPVEQTPLAQKGFTLVELAIVLAVIGLLIGGILRGQEVVYNARVKATMSQILAYGAAMTAFRDQYSQIPGDMSNAEERIPNCNAGTTFCVNGNGDSVIGVIANSAIEDNQTGPVPPRVETTMFWKHLALGHFITGIQPDARPNRPEWGETHPAAKWGSTGFVVGTKTTGSPNLFPSGHILKLTRSTTDPNTYALTSSQAHTLDTKMDDGLPNRGNIGAETVGSNCKTSDGNGGVYEESNDDLRCRLYFRLL